MKVILLKDIPKVGNKDEVKDFKEGYAQNVLLSKGLAILANPHNMQLLQARIDKNKKEKEEENKKFRDILDSLKNEDIKIKVLANEKGHLFKSITKKDISNSIKDKTGKEIGEDYINTNPIKESGLYDIEIKKGDIKGTIKIEIHK